jgi:hypothetical protein
MEQEKVFERKLTIKDVNKIFAEYMGEKIVSVKGSVNIEKDSKVEAVAYHCSWEWLIPVLEKLSLEGKIEFDYYDLYRKAADILTSGNNILK